MAKILIVEDDPVLRDKIREMLESQHYIVEACGDGTEAVSYLAAYKYDLVVLDWNLPGMTGIEIVRHLRQSGDRSPVLMLTGQKSLDAREAGLDSGADDYLTKPFEYRELWARVRSCLRRGAGLVETVLRHGQLVLEPQTHKVTIGTADVRLQPMEFAVLEFFLRHPDEVFSGEALLERVWSSNSEASTNTVKSTMYTLRKKLAAHGQESLITTVHGVGYKLT